MRKNQQNQEFVIPINPENIKQSVEVKVKTLSKHEEEKVEKDVKFVKIK